MNEKMQPDKELLKKFSQNILSGEIDGSDSSEDEDYVCINSETEDNSNSSSSEPDDNDDDLDAESSDESDKSGILIIEEENNDKTANTNGESASNNHKPKKEGKEADLNGDSKEKKASQTKVKEHSICCICLNQKSDEMDELVQCDSCGFFAHEGCYGISDTDSKLTSTSSASTEPWFCNSCLVDDERIEPKIEKSSAVNANNGTNSLKCFTRSCQLCPNVECGLLKETENGRFVHSVCALYTPGVAYQDVDKLWPVVLNEIPSSRWGERICSLCDDIRYSRTGICIQCDAGLCKTYFHVTCAQKFGFLLDPAQAQQLNPNDPFIAYCKLHNDKANINSRKASFLAMISSYKSRHKNEQRIYESGPDKERVQSKFLKVQENYEIARVKARKPLVDKLPKPRMLTTCPSAMKKFTQKLNLNKDVTNLDELIDQQTHHSASIAFSATFVKYYFDREAKIRTNFKELQVQKDLQEKLTKEEVELRKKYEKKCEEHKKTLDENRQVKDRFQVYSNLIHILLPKSHQSGLFSKLLKEKAPSSSIEGNKKATTLEKTTSSTSKASSSGGGKRGRPRLKSTENSSQTANNKSPKPDTTPKKKSLPLNTVINKLSISSCCSICKEKTNSHLLVDCDTCKEFFHITCLEPPLSAVPKKTKLFGWECSKCVKKKSNSSEECESLETSVNAVDDKGCVRRVMKRERKPRNMHSISSSSEKQLQLSSPTKKTKKSVASTGDKEKKRRGRPSLNASLSSAANTSFTRELPSAADGDGTVVVKRPRGRPSIRNQRADSSLQGSVKSASISGRTTTESVLSTKARASTAGEDAEPIYIEDEDDTKGLTNSMTRDSSASSSRSNLVIDMSPTSTTEPQKAFKRSHSKSSPPDPKAIDDVINSVIAGVDSTSKETAQSDDESSGQKKLKSNN